MPVIETTLLNFSLVSILSDVLSEYSNEFVYTAEGIFQRINPPLCPICGEKMVHNGYNEYRAGEFGSVKIGRYLCMPCKKSLQEEKKFWENLISDVSQILATIFSILRSRNVSFEGISEVMNCIMPIGKDAISRAFSRSIEEADLPEAAPPFIVHYDEQYVKIGGVQKYRRTLLNGINHQVIAEELSDNKTMDATETFLRTHLRESIESKSKIFIVTDMGKGYEQLIKKIFGANATHQYCIFHLNQLIAEGFLKNASMKDEFIKYRLFNIFLNRDDVLDYLKPVVEVESSLINQKNAAYGDWLKNEKNKFRNFIYQSELRRRRNKENLKSRTHYESFALMNDLLNDMNSFSNAVQDRIKKILIDWPHFSAFQHVDDAPATNNAIENYYSTSLKDQSKKQFRSDRGIENHMKLSAMRRLGMITKPPITLIEALIKFLPFRAMG
jgi:hypothetical protein